MAEFCLFSVSKYTHSCMQDAGGSPHSKLLKAFHNLQQFSISIPTSLVLLQNSLPYM